MTLERIKKLITGEVARYLIFGVMTTAVNFVVYFAITGLFGDHVYLAANVAAWIAAVAFAYVTNKLFVFESKSWKADVLKRELPSFITARLASLGVEELGLWIMISLLAFDEWAIGLMGFDIGGDAIAKLIMQFIVIVMNYVFSKLVIFKTKGRE